jgi:DNA-binding winged helix-turn-helix (wHTH) protein
MKYAFRDLQIDEDAYEIRRKGLSIDVEPRVLDFVLYLLQHRDRMVSKAELLEHVWGGVAVGDSVVARCASIARRVVGDSNAIRTVHTRGYQWMGPVREQTSSSISASGSRPARGVATASEDSIVAGKRRRRREPSE